VCVCVRFPVHLVCLSPVCVCVRERERGCVCVGERECVREGVCV
jgi:hypothetical protein